MSVWMGTIDVIDGLIEQTIRDGLFALVDQGRLKVTDQFDSGGELLGQASERPVRTSVPPLAGRIACERQPVRVRRR
jgi:hypothetical protein